MRITSNLRIFGGMILLCTAVHTYTYGQISYQQELNRFLAEPALAGASVGLCVLDAKTGQELISHNADLARIPASTMKVVITRYAIELLKLDFRFETHFGYTGAVDSSGVLQGDLIVQGGGDPTLGSGNFPSQTCVERWFKAAQDAGIRAVHGRLILIDNTFQGPPLAGSTAIEDGGNNFGAGAFGLNYRDNTFGVTLRSGRAGEIVEITQADHIPVRLVSHVLASTQSADKAYVYGMPGSDVMHIYGTIPQNRSDFKLNVSMPNPSLFLASEMRNYFKSNGIAILDETELLTDAKKIEFKIVNTIESPSLISILNKTNKNSVNLYAAALFKMIGKVHENDGSFEGAWRAVSKFRTACGKSNTGLFIADGSGLSRLNTLTPRLLTECTLPMEGDFDLALSGGWKPFGGSDLVRVKSGYIGGVRSYAGRISRANGEDLCFSVLVNHGAGSASEVRMAIERWVSTLR